MNTPELIDAYLISGGAGVTDFRGGSADLEISYPDKNI